MFIETVLEMEGVGFANVLYGKVIYREDEDYGAIFVCPEAWRCCRLIVSVHVKVLT